MYVEEWIFIRNNGKVVGTDERQAKDKEMMDELYRRAASDQSLHGIIIKREAKD